MIAFISELVINGNYDASTIPELDQEFARRVLPILKLQILKGGLRLARILNEMGKDFAGGDNVDQILQSALLKNPKP